METYLVPRSRGERPSLASFPFVPVGRSKRSKQGEDGEREASRAIDTVSAESSQTRIDPLYIISVLAIDL